MNWFKSLWGGAANLGRSDNETIQQRIRRHVERRGGAPAVWYAPDQFCSYSQMNENATVISQALKSASGASSPRVCFPSRLVCALWVSRRNRVRYLLSTGRKAQAKRV